MQEKLMFKNIVLFIAFTTTLVTPTLAKERKIYSKNQGLDGTIDLTMLYGTWVRADNPKKNKNKFVIITPGHPSFLKQGVEFFEKKDKNYREKNGDNWNPYASIASRYRSHLRDAKYIIKTRLKIDAISKVPLAKRGHYRVINEALSHVPRKFDENVYAGSTLAFFGYDLNKNRFYDEFPKSAVPESDGGGVWITSDYIAHESLPKRRNNISYKNAIKINKEKYNFDVVGETDKSMLIGRGVNYHFYDIIDENKFIVYRDGGELLHAYKRATTTYQLPIHSQFKPMVKAIRFNKIK